MTSFRPLDERPIYDGYVMRVTVARFLSPDGSVFERDVVRHPGAVAVLPLDGTEVVLVRQYRPAIDAMLTEIPAGLRDVAGEPLVETARRELLEETGLAADSFDELVSVHNAVGFSDEVIHIFVASGLREVPRDVTDSPEEQHMEVVRMPLERAVEMIESGEITDGKTVIALLAALRM